MILIDTSAWIEFFRRRGDQAVKARVAGFVETGDAAFCGPVLYELQFGARAGEMDIITQTMKFCELLDFPLDCWTLGASLEKLMREKGVTVPRDDILVAAAALHHNVPLFCHDKHFLAIAANSTLILK